MRNAEGFLCVFSLHRLSGVRELRKRVRPFRAGSFSLRFSGELR